ncbi:MAG: gamma carbonic anhydrase family protein [Oscillospiraceae bacterium]|nr:gamma carbonic anhydrase family protein [Oscillospiraceae bacterium]
MDMIQKPKMQGAYLAPNASIIGDVVLEEDVNVWYGSVIRGDSGAICVGRGTNIQDNCVLHEEVTIGKNCTIGHGAIVHGCTIGDGCLIGMGAIILNGAILEDGCLVGAGALVTGKVHAPAGSLVLGSPAKVVRELTKEEKEASLEDAKNYIELARKQLILQK